jgi:hypothetical protein
MLPTAAVALALGAILQARQLGDANPAPVIGVLTAPSFTHIGQDYVPGASYVTWLYVATICWSASNPYPFGRHVGS